jgi:hypothetical protein
MEKRLLSMVQFSKVCHHVLLSSIKFDNQIMPVHCRKGFSSSGSIASIVECVSAIFMSLCVAIKFVYH